MQRRCPQRRWLREQWPTRERTGFKHFLEPEKKLVHARFSHQSRKNFSVISPILSFLPDSSLVWSDTAEAEHEKTAGCLTQGTRSTNCRPQKEQKEEEEIIPWMEDETLMQIRQNARFVIWQSIQCRTVTIILCFLFLFLAKNNHIGHGPTRFSSNDLKKSSSR